jgi:hypothetical protein
MKKIFKRERLLLIIVEFGNKPSSLRRQNEEQSKIEEESSKKESSQSGRTPNVNTTPRYLKEYRKKKEQGKKIRAEIESQKSIKSNKSLHKSRDRSSQKQGVSTPSVTKPRPPKRPANIDYLTRLAQPKTQSKYVLIKEDSSSSKSSENSVDERQKKIQEEKAERNLYKKGLDLAQLISRESPRETKEKK